MSSEHGLIPMKIKTRLYTRSGQQAGRYRGGSSSSLQGAPGPPRARSMQRPLCHCLGTPAGSRRVVCHSDAYRVATCVYISLTISLLR